MEVYLFPCSDVNAFNRFEKVVQNEISLLSISTGLDQNISDDIKNNVGENFRLWGVMPGTNNYPTWNNVN